LKVGDNKSNYFHQYANFYKSLNTIWEIENEEGVIVRPFVEKA
jgi:hypothetical protein